MQFNHLKESYKKEFVQGTRHSPAEIAPYWKKDSRMWLWKSVRLARRRTKAKTPASTLYREDFS